MRSLDHPSGYIPGMLKYTRVGGDVWVKSHRNVEGGLAGRLSSVAE
jgi:hypothetical protein